MGCTLGHRLHTNPRMFRVYNIDKNGDARTMGRIEITEEELILHQKGKPPVCWPLRSVRRYGFDAELFSFESGRRCPTGQGIYAFKCQRAEALFNLLQECIQLAGQQQQHDQEPPARMLTSDTMGTPPGSNRPTPPPHIEPWQDTQLPTYVNREVIVAAAAAAASEPGDPQHQYVNTAVLSNNSAVAGRSSSPSPEIPALHYAQLDLPGTEDQTDTTEADNLAATASATYVNVCADSNQRRCSNNSSRKSSVDPSGIGGTAIHAPPMLTQHHHNAAAAVTPPAAAATDDVNYIQVEIVSTGDSVPSSPAATQVITSYTFPSDNDLSNQSIAAGPSTTGGQQTEEKYAIIDFDKTYAINHAKSNEHDHEGVRKTRHNSNLEDCA